MSDQAAREFLQMLAVPGPVGPPPCPICGHSHPLETRCALPSRENPLEAGGLSE